MSEFTRLQELFDRARRLSAAERATFLAAELGDNAELEAEIQRLLRFYDSGDQPLDERAIQLVTDEHAIASAGLESEEEGDPGEESESERDEPVTDP